MSPKWSDFAPPPRDISGDYKWNVFLSYRSVNRAWVLGLYDVLRELGHQVFIDQVVLKAGDPLTRVLEENLVASQAGILIWSSAAADSSWVGDEYAAMRKLEERGAGFLFVPVRLDDEELPLFASTKVFLNFAAYPDGPNGGELLRLLHAISGKALSDEAAHFASEQDEAAAAALIEIKAAIDLGQGRALLRLFEEGGLPWETTPVLGCRVADGLARIGDNENAVAVLEVVEKRFPKSIRPKQLRALALARRAEERVKEIGRAAATSDDQVNADLDDAQFIMGKLEAAGEDDPETLGIYARTWMDRRDLGGDVGDLGKSRALYVRAFEGAQDDYYTGINAAAKSVFVGTDDDLKKAAELADRVQEIVGTEAIPGDYWHTATVGEVFLIKQDYESAARLYDLAVTDAIKEVGSHKSTWKQACRLMNKLEPAADQRAMVRAAFKHLPDCDEMLVDH